ncbi:hypothetical protein [Pseudomonas cichorii]|uniref:hypothetical protein n=1 Tax=Pseudomonas cichorii TaxID=36746 RepID=UPI001F3F747B|nr:hypothetical protein [Pseudomonas cichorii]
MGDHLLEPLLAISIGNVTLESSSSEFFIRRIGNGFGHEVLGRVVNLERRLVRVGPIIVELDDVLPGGISFGDMVGFSCGRLDVIS